MTTAGPDASRGAGESEAKGGCPFGSASDVLSFPMPRDWPLDPPPEYKRLRLESPITRVRLWNGTQAWLITRYDDIRAMLSDPRFSANADHPGFPGQSPGMAVVRQQYRTFTSMDPPEHTVYRRMLTGEFTVKRMEAMREKIQGYVDTLIDDMLRVGPPLDFVQSFAVALPSLIICDLLGVPYEDHEFFQAKARLVTSNKTSKAEAEQATRELCDEYLARLIERKNADPQDDLLSRLIVNHMRKGEVTGHQVVSMARQLLFAGHNTTANTTALGTLALLHHPEQLALLRSDPSLVDSAIEEILRYIDVTHAGRRRVALEDVVIAGQVVRAGEGVIAANPSANRDEAVFPDPDRFDITRNRRDHLAFGYGVHQCLGQPLARVEMRVVFSTLFKRIPTLALAEPIERLGFLHEVFTYGVEALPVTWSTT
jgi:cytochrome P450